MESSEKVETLARDGSEGAQDGTGKSCSFFQVHGICSVSATLFTTDAAAGRIKLMTGLSGTTDFLEHLAILYDTFGITCKASTSKPITPEQVIQNLNTVDGYIKATVMNVKETSNLKEDSTTNGPQVTVSQKTQASIELLLNDFNQVEEYESDSDDSDDDVDIESEELVIGKPIITRTGQGLMFRCAQNESQYHDKNELLEKIAKELRQLELQTRTDLALKMAPNQLFTEEGGDRPDTVMIVLTDGKPIKPKDNRKFNFKTFADEIAKYFKMSLL
ncbi:hypothetical protein AWC38_SpisGene23106 [Stylophora pistillata]|uniref:VWFA domain-containing protein n=1 Tax=Stylophora pistillata TaxID=50429 RepID=A0A2B4R934_STYPI|nr:hypothetical protein AWC38_SpisGene23106 [Stylophora pistillata]